jgi:hypothetical protein
LRCVGAERRRGPEERGRRHDEQQNQRPA